jgi:hypothetical protein
VLIGASNNKLFVGGLGNDIIDGGGGVDTVDYSTENLDHVIVNLTTGGAAEYKSVPVDHPSVLVSTDHLYNIEKSSAPPETTRSRGMGRTTSSTAASATTSSTAARATQVLPTTS